MSWSDLQVARRADEMAVPGRMEMLASRRPVFGMGARHDDSDRAAAAVRFGYLEA